jgi:transposase
MRALLLAGDGVANTAIAKAVGASPASVTAWRERFAAEGLARFWTMRGEPGAKSSISAEKIAAICTPPCRTTAGADALAGPVDGEGAGVSPATVQRTWHARGLPPHRVETFQLSDDKRFEEKLTDVAGLYMNPLDNAVVLCMDEKSQIQALDRTQPTLPMKKGRDDDP